MNICGIYYCDVANGPGMRTSLYVSGCTHHCPGCFNEKTWDFNYGREFTKEDADAIIKSLKPSYIQGLSLLGGEPFEPVNQKELRPFLERVRAEVPGINIWSYSGFTWEQLNDINCKRCFTVHTKEMLEMIDVLIDGRFVEEKKDLTLRFRGSSNQRIINVPESFKEGRAVIMDEYMC